MTAKELIELWKKDITDSGWLEAAQSICSEYGDEKERIFEAVCLRSLINFIKGEHMGKEQ